MSRQRRPVARSLLARHPLEVAPDLLGLLLVAGDGRAGRIVEVEAYTGPDDPASHAYRGRTARNATMWGPAGRLYVYFTYGMHWCANVTCGKDGVPGAVLLRALEPVAGLEAMRAARWRGQRDQRDRNLCRGPGRLCQALGIDGRLDGTDVVGGGAGGRRAAADRPGGGTALPAGTLPPSDVVTPMALVDDGATPPAVQRSTRIGVRQAADRPWRYSMAGSPWVSR